MKKMAWTLGFLLACILIAGPAGCWAQAWAQERIKFAAILPGTVQDGEYNWLAAEALKAAAQGGFCETAYSEKVSVPDAGRVMREYIAAGNKVIWAHGSQFNNAVDSLVNSYPEVTFIVELEPKPEVMKPNIWYLDRNRHTGFYPLGVLGSLVTKTKKIGYIGGVPLPFHWADIHATKQALKDVRSDANLKIVMVGDFNDPVKAKQSAEVLITSGCDVLLSELSLGNTGVIQAVKEATKIVAVAFTFTSRKDQVPKQYLTTDMYDFARPIKQILKQVKSKTKGGYSYMEYGYPGKPRFTEMPIANVSPQVNKKIQQTIDDIVTKKIKVVFDQTKD